ncbi:MAG TPA: Rieske 2Fe-2S domain-containing protein, partial [Gemmatimonadaceae bacterium]
NGEIHTMGDECTHHGYRMSSGTIVDGGCVEYGWHGTVFDCRTGAVKRGPAVEPLPIYAVKVDGDLIYVGECLL